MKETEIEMEQCIFCKIIKGEIDSAKIWEDKEFLAILDVNPNTKGMTLLLTKKHYDSYVFDMEEDVYQRFMKTTKKVVKILEKGLDVKRVAMVMEGMGINHAHIKLYPLHGITEKFREMWGKEKVFFNKYQGYISTQLGPKIDIAELKKLAEEIKKKT
ncbi:MAG: HIT family protein [Candidatus Nealsonbacteria bacterium]